MKLISVNTKLLLQDDDKSLFECLLGLKKKQINPVVRSFAITMQSYSTRAYEYLRQRFHNNLPHANTIGHWHANSSFCERSGITKTAILQLKEMSSELKSQGKELIASLCFDETSMQKHLQWRDSDKRFLGFIDIGKRPEHVDWPISTQVLVFLLNGINFEFSIPVAYYFITSLNAKEKKTVLLEVIENITNAGVKLVNITFDGLITNFGMCQQLGASFNLSNPKTYFINPTDGSNIFIMLDACHMLKLLRNCIGTYDLHDGEGRIISWKFFKSLEVYRKKHDLVTHKMTKKHIEWEKNKMNVSLAAQTLSKSVADSMEYLRRQGIRSFQDCEGTVKFIRTANSLFDIFNSSKEHDNDHFKSPLNQNSFQSISEFLTETIEYLSTLKIDRQNIMTSKRKTGFKGFVINIHSLFDIWKGLAINSEISLRTYALSQDPLESFFGRIRSSLGCNDNPTQEQFTAAYRRQLIPNEIISSQFANCKDKLRIMHITSANSCFQELSEENIQNDRKRVEELTDTQEFINRSIDDIHKTSLAYNASLIEKKITATKFECEICEKVFESDAKFLDNISESIFVPCKSTVAICEHTSKFVDILRIEHHLNYDILLEKILLSLNFDALFSNSDFSHDPYHKDWIVRFIVEDFFRMQAVYIARNLTMESKDFVRSMYRKAIHRSNE